MKNLLLMLLVLVPTLSIKAQTEELACGTSNSEEPEELVQLRGRYLTAIGELKVLVVFAKFKDDINPHQYWPADSYPSEMNEYIDPSMQKGSTHYMNLTNYYNQMSFGKFKVIGKVIGAETPYPRSHYISENETFPDRSLANKVILQSIDDSIDYREYDNWTYNNNYYHSNESDGIVDMIIIIWRGLVFSNDWSGMSSLGRGEEFQMEDNQVRIRTGYGKNLDMRSNGSGVTVQYRGERSPEKNFKNVIHEVAHWLIGSGHPYTNKPNHTIWGMLTHANEGICANAFERERLGWLNPVSIEGSILSAQIGDYITTPSAYKYVFSNGTYNEYYYFENHQKLSVYDNGTSNANDKGIFILHFNGKYYSGDCARIITSDGFWNWESPYSGNCWENNIATFQKAGVNRNGLGNRDKITSSNSNSEFLYSYLDEYGVAECNDWLHGYGFNNAFDTSFNDVFSNWSNPPALMWDGQPTDFSMDVISQSGSIITARFTIQNSIEGKPSKPHLGWDPGKTEYDNEVYLAWGADFWDGDPIEPDVNWSELQKKVGSGSWNTVYSGPNRIWNENINIDILENTTISYRARVRDSQNQLSIWSDIKTIKYNVSSSLNDMNVSLSDFRLYQNYPNPFNPATVITYSLPQRTHFTLKVFDLLGREVATLVNEEKPAGNYEVEFNSAHLSSGVYLYKLQAGSFIETKKMILIK